MMIVLSIAAPGRRPAQQAPEASAWREISGIPLFSRGLLGGGPCRGPLIISLYVVVYPYLAKCLHK